MHLRPASAGPSADGRELPSQGPDLLAFAARLGPAPPLPPLPSDLDCKELAELDDFTPEERRLERESEEAKLSLFIMIQYDM